MFPLRDVASGPWEFTMSILCSLHSGVRTAMIYMHRLNRGGKGVRSPADSLIQGLPRRSYHGPMPILLGLVNIAGKSLNRQEHHRGICGPVSRKMQVSILSRASNIGGWMQ